MGREDIIEVSRKPNNVVASDGRYHKYCKTEFFLNVKDDEEEDTVNVSFLRVTKDMTTDKSRIWNSVELYNMYTANNNKILHYASNELF